MTTRGKKVNQGNLYDDDLFSASAGTGTPRKREPLAARVRPRKFSDFVGQDHVVGDGKLLRRAIEADQLTSIILWGPPGSGKTTLANIIANETHSDFVTLNAVLDGVKELRDVIEIAKSRPKNVKTLLFVDEIHRWNKAQQDGLLPHVESGIITLIGATTENPYFSLVTPLLSRSRVFRLESLKDEHIKRVLQNALTNTESGFGKGYGDAQIVVDDSALNHLVDVAGGDARSALNALEMAVLTTPKADDGRIHISLDVAAESIQQRAIRYDRDQDEHYDTISAFIKSVRGSDPDAALYWLAKMLVAGEDPRFLFRRMIILACEDVGLADPNAISVVHACADAFERVGLPEGNYLLSQACLVLATAPKSNTAGALFTAMAYIEKNGSQPVPPHLRDSTSSNMQARGEGTESATDNYQYPHDYPGAWVDQQYLPEGMSRPNWYSPKSVGAESQIAARFAERDQSTSQSSDESASITTRSAIRASQSEKRREQPPEIPADQPIERMVDTSADQSLTSTDEPEITLESLEDEPPIPDVPAKPSGKVPLPPRPPVRPVPKPGKK